MIKIPVEIKNIHVLRNREEGVIEIPRANFIALLERGVLSVGFIETVEERDNFIDWCFYRMYQDRLRAFVEVSKPDVLMGGDNLFGLNYSPEVKMKVYLIGDDFEHIDGAGQRIIKEEEVVTRKFRTR